MDSHFKDGGFVHLKWEELLLTQANYDSRVIQVIQNSFILYGNGLSSNQKVCLSIIQDSRYSFIFNTSPLIHIQVPFKFQLLHSHHFQVIHSWVISKSKNKSRNYKIYFIHPSFIYEKSTTKVSSCGQYASLYKSLKQFPRFKSKPGVIKQVHKPWFASTKKIQKTNFQEPKLALHHWISGHKLKNQNHSSAAKPVAT